MSATETGTEAILSLIAALTENTAALRESTAAHRGGGSGGGGGNRAAGGSGGASGVCFPNYGRSKLAPVKGASAQDLEYYRAGCMRTLNDPGKARFHDKERVLLAAIDAEMGGGKPAENWGGFPDGPPPDDNDTGGAF